MLRHTDDWDDPDEPPDDDLGDDEDAGPDTWPCRSCRAEVFEGSPRCPHCGADPEASNSPWADRPFWWVVLGLLGILTVAYGMVRDMLPP